jgi:hypothetical protein
VLALANVLTECSSHPTLAPWKCISLPEQEARLSKIATKEGVDPEELVKVAALRMLEDDARFRVGVQKGIEQAELGQFVEEEMDVPRQTYDPVLMRTR